MKDADDFNHNFSSQEKSNDSYHLEILSSYESSNPKIEQLEITLIQGLVTKALQNHTAELKLSP